MIRKIIISIIILILFGVLCSAQVERGSSSSDVLKEVLNRTNLQHISDQEFKFPSSEEAAEVFAKGKELLLRMRVESVLSKKVPQQIDSDIDRFSIYLPDLLNMEQKNKNFSFRKPILRLDNKQYSNQYFNHYQDFYRQIVWKDNGAPDITKAATAKAYLAFYNLVNVGKMSHLQVGRIDEHFPLLGVHSDAFVELQEKFGNDNAYLWFTYELYHEKGRRDMIPPEDAEKAKEIAKQILYQDLQNYGITKNQADEWLKFATSWKSYALIPSGSSGGITQVSLQGNWYSTIFIRPNCLGEDQYRVALHEFQHVKDFFPCTTEEYSLNELTPGVKDVVLYDQIYRKIHAIPYNQAIVYKHSNDYLGINLGEIARFFQDLSQKYQTDNYAQLLMTEEAVKYIYDNYDRFLKNVVSVKLKERGDNPLYKSKKEIEEMKGVIDFSLQEVLRKYFKHKKHESKVVPD